jgi:hypothetical protein
MWGTDMCRTPVRVYSLEVGVPYQAKHAARAGAADPLGAIEVQAPARSFQGSKTVVGSGSSRQTNALSSLAVTRRWDSSA